MDTGEGDPKITHKEPGEVDRIIQQGKKGEQEEGTDTKQEHLHFSQPAGMKFY